MTDTREKILETAWSLFAERGFDGVSVRDVTTEAGVNLASVSYHFGGKDGLIQETLKRCMDPVYAYTIKLLEDAKEEYGGVEKIPMNRLLACWLRPVLMPEECGVRFDLLMRLIARYLIKTNSPLPGSSQKLMVEMYRVYVDAFRVHCGDLTDEQLIKQIMFVKGAAMHSSGLGGSILRVLKGESGEDTVELDREEVLEDLVQCASLGFGSEKKCG
jgi:AcrR family transcriptional regulator